MVHLVSNMYPLYSPRSLVICNLGVLADVKIKATVMDIHSLEKTSACSFELTITGEYASKKLCAEPFFSFNETINEVEFRGPVNQNWTVQMIFQSDQNPSNQGKFWLAFEGKTF